jgi:ATP:corrinoid adenosyltransferase
MNEEREAHGSPDRSAIVRRRRLMVFTGDGKGKTTAALGLALRVASHWMHVQMLHSSRPITTVSEIHEVKHGWRQGVAAEEGIEY